MASELRDFIRKRISSDLEEGKLDYGVITRFPPEPNGLLHIGHAKSIALNFGVTEEFGGETFLRFDDTNPLKESDHFVQAIQEDVRWLGYDWGDRLTYASDYFPQLYHFAEKLIEGGSAFVCDLSVDEIRATRGTLTSPGQDSPYRDRSIGENLRLFREMRAGEHPEGSKVLRAKIDMKSPNINMRDPVLYRILFAEHHRTGTDWCIYPMYDFTHCICDALERITHSLCTLEFEDHRPLYDWVLDNIGVNHHPPQIEFSRLGLEYNVMSKRIFTALIDEGYLNGWDDPRMPTIAGLRRRGVPSSAIREFTRRIGVTKQDNLVETELLDFCIRKEFEETAPRGMAILNPLKVVITNFEGEDESLEATWHPKNEAMGMRTLGFGREIYIESTDFSEDPPRKFRRLSEGSMVRLRYAYIIRCDKVIRNDKGDVVELRATYVPESRSGSDTSGLKPKGTIHFISKSNAVPAEFRLFGKLFKTRIPSSVTFLEEIDVESLVTKHGLVERAVVEAKFGQIQFERTGYFVEDDDSTADHLVFNRTVTLSDGYKVKDDQTARQSVAVN